MIDRAGRARAGWPGSAAPAACGSRRAPGSWAQGAGVSIRASCQPYSTAEVAGRYGLRASAYSTAEKIRWSSSQATRGRRRIETGPWAGPGLECEGVRRGASRPSRRGGRARNRRGCAARRSRRRRCRRTRRCRRPSRRRTPRGGRPRTVPSVMVPSVALRSPEVPSVVWSTDVSARLSCDAPCRGRWCRERTRHVTCPRCGRRRRCRCRCRTTTCRCRRPARTSTRGWWSRGSCRRASRGRRSPPRASAGSARGGCGARTGRAGGVGGGLRRRVAVRAVVHVRVEAVGLTQPVLVHGLLLGQAAVGLLLLELGPLGLDATLLGLELRLAEKWSWFWTVSDGSPAPGRQSASSCCCFFLLADMTSGR